METNPTLADDIARLARQEEALQFDHFTAHTAWELGCRLKAAVEARGQAVAIAIQLAGQPLFFYAMPGTTPDNGDWIRRKVNVVEHYHRSSYAVGLHLRHQQTTLTDKAGLPARDYAPHGGSFPIRLRGSGLVGTITISGLPQRDDHNVIVAVLADYLGLPLADLALDPLS